MGRLKELCVCFLVLLFSCKSGHVENRPEVPEDKNVEVKILRFDKDIFTPEGETLKKELPGLTKKYPDFLPRFGQMLNIGKPADSAFALDLGHFTSDPEVRKVYTETEAAYKDLKDVEKTLSDAFTLYSYYFPERKVPQAIAYVSGFNYAIAVGESFVGVGLDMYMGEDYRYYSLLQFPQFKLPEMRREYIAPDMVKAWCDTEFPKEDKSTELLSSIVHEGKMIMLAKKLMPELPDSLTMGFSNKQLEWLEKNEKRIWAYIIDHKLLFSTNYAENARYLNEAPFTPGMPKDSPGRTVVWVGYKMVQSFMQKHPAVTLQKMLVEKDARKVLNESGYKPMK
jgi:hypothetical protein